MELILQDATDVSNTHASLIMMDKNKKEIVHQEPYRYYLFADMRYPYFFTNEGKYSLSLLTKIAGHEKYEDNPLIAIFDLDTENTGNTQRYYPF